MASQHIIKQSNRTQGLIREVSETEAYRQGAFVEDAFSESDALEAISDGSPESERAASEGE